MAIRRSFMKTIGCSVLSVTGLLAVSTAFGTARCSYQTFTGATIVGSQVTLENQGDATWTLVSQSSMVPGGTADAFLPSSGYLVQAYGQLQDQALMQLLLPYLNFSPPPTTLKPHTTTSFRWAARTDNVGYTWPELILEYKSNHGQVIILDYMMRNEGCEMESVLSMPASTLGYITHRFEHVMSNEDGGYDSVHTTLGTPSDYSRVPTEIDWTFKTHTAIATLHAPVIANTLEKHMSVLQKDQYDVTCSVNQTSSTESAIQCKAVRDDSTGDTP